MTRRERIEAMLADTPDDPELRYFLAMEYVAEGSLEQGLTALSEVNRIAPKYVPAYLQAGQLLVKLGRDEEARAMYRTGIAQAKAVGDHHAGGEMEAFLDAISG
jgi:Tfp pilus assembly protein PilF